MKALTRKEKIRLLSGVGDWHTYDCNGKLPSIMMTDGPHGLRKKEHDEDEKSKIATCFPTASAIACSWDTELVAKMADAIAKEAIAEKVSIVLGCGVNMKRSPLCGRNFEYYSEDPYLAGTLATAYIKAVQKQGVGTSLKHFAANNQETNRQTSNSQIDERALREIYLRAFEMVVKEAQPTTIMASYNRLNGTYACANKRLLTDILRNEWGFQGAVISDWGAAADVVACIKAGMDLEMPDSLGIHGKQIEKALKSGELTEEQLDQAVNRIVTLVESQANKLRTESVLYEEHHQLAVELECESAVLLKNNGMLPIKKGSTVVVIGDMAKHMRYQGGGSSHINTRKTNNALNSLKEQGLHVLYATGYRSETDTIDETLEEKAVELAKKGEKILFFGGLTEEIEGEGYDRTSLSMPKNQLHLLYRLREENPNIAVITFGGSAMEMPFAKAVKAILHMYLGGQGVGEACAKLITGEANPCGKLAETFPMTLRDVPSYEYFGKKTNNVQYRESLFIGYRYYTTYKKQVRYPFGYGLSYTTFAYSNLTCSQNLKTMNKDGSGKVCYTQGKLQVSLRVKNTGNFEGKEIVQLYIENPKCNFLRPIRELRGFAKVNLLPGEEKEVTMYLDESSFSIYDETEKAFIMPSGEYTIQIASSVENIRLEKKLMVNGIDYHRNDKKRLREYFMQSEHGFHITGAQFEELYQKPIQSFENTKKGEFTIYHPLEELAKHSLIAKITLGVSVAMVHYSYRNRKKNDPEVMMIVMGIREGMLDSVICQSKGALSYRLGEAIVLSANGHPIKAWMHLIGGM